MASSRRNQSKPLRKLTEQQIIEFRRVFRFFDKNNDGHITVAELAACVEACGRKKTDSELRNMIRQVDANNSGALEFNEFVTLMQMTLDECNAEEKMKDAFRVFDRDGDGVITTEELRQAMRDHQDVFCGQQINDLLRRADKNGDGQIDYEEFVQMCKSRPSSSRKK